jgi:hypothetical protein
MYTHKNFIFTKPGKKSFWGNFVENVFLFFHTYYFQSQRSNCVKMYFFINMDVKMREISHWKWNLLPFDMTCAVFKHNIYNNIVEKISFILFIPKLHFHFDSNTKHWPDDNFSACSLLSTLNGNCNWCNENLCGN